MGCGSWGASCVAYFTYIFCTYTESLYILVRHVQSVCTTVVHFQEHSPGEAGDTITCISNLVVEVATSTYPPLIALRGARRGVSPLRHSSCNDLQTAAVVRHDDIIPAGGFDHHTGTHSCWRDEPERHPTSFRQKGRRSCRGWVGVPADQSVTCVWVCATAVRSIFAK